VDNMALVMLFKIAPRSDAATNSSVTLLQQIQTLNNWLLNFIEKVSF